ncbi:MAG: Zn-dependent oxidoreductase, NADPH:quinone reductase, partial [Verrucomicrobiales bacterium]|nr:Zn-dependent oxidoreductase, NADPH:quinone reductase [Verrucomicrobiales bacterium]
MKAIRVHQFGGPEVMKLEEVPNMQPSDGEVLVRIRAVGVNPVDTYILAGSYDPKPTLPYTPGKDAAGEVVGTGERVYITGSVTGANADHALCKSFDVHPLPKRLSFEQGAAVGVPYATAYRALFQRARAIAGETILIHGGSGGVGTAAIQLARNAGMVVIATAGTDEGIELTKKLGAQHVLNHRKPDYLNEIAKITSGRGVDVILEMLSNVNLGKDLTVLAMSGRISVIGSRGPVEINPRDAMKRDADIRGVMLGNATAADRAEIFAALGAGFENGTLTPIVGKILPLAEAAKAHEEVMKPGAHGKIVL